MMNRELLRENNTLVKTKAAVSPERVNELLKENEKLNILSHELAKENEIYRSHSKERKPMQEKIKGITAESEKFKLQLDDLERPPDERIFYTPKLSESGMVKEDLGRTLTYKSHMGSDPNIRDITNEGKQARGNEKSQVRSITEGQLSERAQVEIGRQAAPKGQVLRPSFGPSEKSHRPLLARDPDQSQRIDSQPDDVDNPIQLEASRKNSQISDDRNKPKEHGEAQPTQGSIPSDFDTRFRGEQVKREGVGTFTRPGDSRESQPTWPKGIEEKKGETPYMNLAQKFDLAQTSKPSFMNMSEEGVKVRSELRIQEHLEYSDRIQTQSPHYGSQQEITVTKFSPELVHKGSGDADKKPLQIQVGTEEGDEKIEYDIGAQDVPTDSGIHSSFHRAYRTQSFGQKKEGKVPIIESKKEEAKVPIRESFKKKLGPRYLSPRGEQPRYEPEENEGDSQLLRESLTEQGVKKLIEQKNKKEAEEEEEKKIGPGEKSDRMKEASSSREIVNKTIGSTQQLQANPLQPKPQIEPHTDEMIQPTREKPEPQPNVVERESISQIKAPVAQEEHKKIEIEDSILKPPQIKPHARTAQEPTVEGKVEFVFSAEPIGPKSPQKTFVKKSEVLPGQDEPKSLVASLVITNENLPKSTVEPQEQLKTQSENSKKEEEKATATKSYQPATQYKPAESYRGQPGESSYYPAQNQNTNVALILLGSAFEMLVQRNKEILQESEGLKQYIEELQDQRDKLLETVNAKNQEGAEKKIQKPEDESSNTLIESLKKENQALLAERDKLLESVSQKDKELEANAHNFEKLTKDNDQLITRIFDLENAGGQLGELRRMFDSASHDRDNLRNLLEERDKQISTLENKLRAKAAELSEAMDKAAVLVNEGERLNHECADLKLKVLFNENLVGNVEREKNDLEKEIKDRDGLIKDLQSHIDKITEDHGSLLNSLKERGEKLENLQQQMTEMSQEKLKLASELDAIRPQILKIKEENELQVEELHRLNQLLKNSRKGGDKEGMKRAGIHEPGEHHAEHPESGELHEVIEAKTAQIKELQESNERLQAEHIELQQKLDQALKANDELQLCSTGLAEEVASLRGQIASNDLEIKELRELKKELEEGIQELQLEKNTGLAEAQKRIAELLNLISERDEALQIMARQLEAAQALGSQDTQAMQEKQGLLESEIALLNAQLVIRESEIKSLNSKMQELELVLAEIDEVKNHLESFKTERDRLVDTLKDKDEEIQKLQQIMGWSGALIEDVDRRSMANLKQDNAALDEICRSQQAQIEALQARIEELENQLNERGSQSGRNEEEFAIMAGEIEELRKHLESLAQDREGLVELLREKDRELAKLRSAAQQMSETNQMLASEIAHLKEKLSQLKTAEDKAEVVAFDADKERLKAENEELNKSIEQMAGELKVAINERKQLLELLRLKDSELHQMKTSAVGLSDAGAQNELIELKDKYQTLERMYIQLREASLELDYVKDKMDKVFQETEKSDPKVKIRTTHF